MKFEGDIYIPNKKFLNLDTTQKWYWIGIILFLVFCFLAIKNQDTWKNDTLDSFFKICCFISLGIFMIGKFGAIQSTEEIKGKLSGRIIITDKFIEINSDKYSIEDIEGLKFSIVDYRGEYRHPGINHVGPWYMAGLNNKIEFKYMNKIIVTKFRIDLEDEFETLKKINLSLTNTIANNG